MSSVPAKSRISIQAEVRPRRVALVQGVEHFGMQASECERVKVRKIPLSFVLTGQQTQAHHLASTSTTQNGKLWPLGAIGSCIKAIES